MPSIEELLNEAESHMAAQPVNDVLEINPETREISIPDSEIILGVETDQKAERKYFHCPKIVGNNIDLSALELYVVFQNASNMEKGKDRYHVTDVKTTSDGYITFSWELSAKVTAYKGDVQFVVCAIKTDSSGVKQNVWNTTIAIGKCLIGLSSDMSESEEQSASDLYTQLISELNSTASAKLTEVTTQIQTVGNNQVSNVNNAGTTQVNNVQNKGTEVLASIPDTYTELDASVKQLNEQIRGKAPVITERATIQSGSHTTVTDSAEMQLQGLRLYGKSWQETTTGANLFDANDVSQGFISDDTGNNMVETDSYCSNFIAVSAKTKYYLHSDQDAGRWGAFYDSSKTFILGIATDKYNTVFETPENAAYIRFTVDYNNNNPNFARNVIFAKSTVALPFEPYTGGKPSPSPEYPQEIASIGENGSIDVGIVGKNLFGGKTFADKVKDSFKGEIDETQKTIAFYAQNTKSVVLFNVPDKNKRYTLIAKGNCSSKVQYLNLCFLYDNGEQESLFFNNANTKQSFVSNAHKKLVSIAGYYNDGLTKLYYEDFGLFEGVLTLNDFEPYHKSTTTIPLSNGLPGIPVTTGGNYTDANGKQYICDEIDFVRGKYIQRVWQAEFDGSEDEKWLKGGANYISNGCLPVVMNSRKGFCNQYIVGNATRGIRIGNGNAMLIVFDDFLDENALSNFKAHLASNPLVVMTYLDTPIETDLTEAQIQAYKSLTTFKPTSIISNDAGAQMEVEYACDTKTWVTNKINTLIKEATTS